MRPERLLDQPEDLADAEATIATNLLGPIRLNAALLPVLQKQLDATVMTVSSGILAFVPLAMTPTYCATKAAIHSYTQSLRYQLKNTNVKVIELIPPYVQTTLMGDHRGPRADPRAMPLVRPVHPRGDGPDPQDRQPDATEVKVQRVLPLRCVPPRAGQEKYEEFFTEIQRRHEGALKARRSHRVCPGCVEHPVARSRSILHHHRARRRDEGRRQSVCGPPPGEEGVPS